MSPLWTLTYPAAASLLFTTRRVNYNTLEPTRSSSLSRARRLHATVEQSLAFHARNKRERIFSDIRYLLYCPTLY
ncbi:hypothetical protein Taro_025690 [Colocasia esculenta]|uniref:Uncharacterized protein n=1 Tax=Colocasia esculenta TaxID=4460 RepID=A0A843VL85_COLES|nr:hypothetical protein [Colocasia esculenta]